MAGLILNRVLLLTCVLTLTLARDDLNDPLIKRQGFAQYQYGQLQPFPDPPLQQGFQPTFKPSPEIQPGVKPGITSVADAEAVQAAAQAAANAQAAAANAQAGVQAAADAQAAADLAAADAQVAADQAQNQATFQCDQTITGRNFEYQEALQIVQNEEYLSDSDFDEIRIIRRQGVPAHENYNKWTVDNVLESVAQKSEHKSVRRSKRYIFPQIVTSTDSIIPSSCPTNYVCNTDSVCTGSSSSSSSPALCDSNCCSTDIVSEMFGFTNCESFPECLVYPILLVGVLGLILSQPYPGNIPIDAPQPGTPGGGGLPTAASPTLAESLSLVPAGLTPVSVFPPWATARTVPAVGVIFKEAPGTLAGVDPTFRKKREATYHHQSPPNPLKTLFKKLVKNLRCLGPRLTRKFGRKPSHNTSYGYGGRKKRDNHPEYYSHYEEDYYHNPHERDYQFYEDFSVDTIEDCFADIPAPRYGYVVRITYTRTGPPRALYYAQSRQTGEGFRSAAPPDCRVITY